MKILRWIAVLPAAVVGGGLASIIVRFVDKMFNPVLGYKMFSLIDELIYNVVMGAVFVLAGSFVAPEYHKTTSVVLATICTVICIASLCIQLFYIGIADWKIILACIGAAAGSIIGSVQVHDDKGIE